VKDTTTIPMTNQFANHVLKTTVTGVLGTSSSEENNASIVKKEQFMTKLAEIVEDNVEKF